MAENKTKPKRKLTWSNWLAFIIFILIGLFLLGSFIWHFFIPWRYKAHLVDKMRGGIAAVQFAHSRTGEPVIFVSEGIKSYFFKKSTARVSRTHEGGYNYFWLVSLDPSDGKVLALTELPKKQTRYGAEYYGGVPGRVWLRAQGWLQLRDPATGELIADEEEILSKVDSQAKDAVEDGDFIPSLATGDLILFENSIPMWRMSPKDFSLQPIADFAALKPAYKKSTEKWAQENRWTWAYFSNGTRFNLEPLSEIGDRTESMNIKITRPDGTTFLVPSPEDKTKPLTLPYIGILKDNLDNSLIVAQNPKSIFLESHDYKEDDTILMRMDGDGNIIWQRRASELPDYGVAFQDVDVHQTHAQGDQLIVWIGERLISFDMADGKVRWIYGYSTKGRYALFFIRNLHRLRNLFK